MKRVPVSSSNLRSVGYLKKKRLLEIMFKHGGVYQYRNVPPDIHAGLMNARSHGRYHWRHVRTSFPYSKVR